MAKASTGNWLRTNEVQEFIGALEFAAEILPSVSRRPIRWKWAIIALHNALQGACVCAIRGADTSGICVLDRTGAAAMWQWLNVDSRKSPRPPPPEEKLATTLELYKRVKKNGYLQNPLVADAHRDYDIRKLNALRNDFIHFVPKGLSIELSGMPSIVRTVHSCVEHLAVNFPTFDHHFRPGDRKRILKALSRLEAYWSKS
jgi:hypothetical protein